MTNGARQMTAHVEAAYKDAVENLIFLKRQQPVSLVGAVFTAVYLWSVRT